MNSLVFLYAGALTEYALKPLMDGPSAFERCVKTVSKLKDVKKTIIFVTEGFVYPDFIQAIDNIECIEESSWTVAVLFEKMALYAESYDTIYFSWADCPFIDIHLSNSIIEKHYRYSAEYSFAEGYPYGLSLDIVHAGLLSILKKVCEKDNNPVNRNVIFEAIEKDINSYDIETDIAPKDVRYLRLQLSCDSKRNYLMCEKLIDITAENYSTYVFEQEQALRTVPAYYAIQVAGRCPHECIFCPYPDYCLDTSSISKGISAVQRQDYMDIKDFSVLIDKISQFSNDAVISLSLWGECSYHPHIVELIHMVLKNPNLSILIETTGIGWNEAILQEIATIVNSSLPRTHKHPAIHWIVSLDAISAQCYSLLHKASEEAFREALATTETLLSLFPGLVWPQCIRMNENEAELESFYRFWKEKSGQLIVQKHDHFCKTIQDRRVADLSPLQRYPCWHLKRDLCILIDGTIPLCKEDVYAKHSLGNIFTDDLPSIWDGNTQLYVEHCQQKYKGLCENCDEYYTYNF